MDSIEPLPVVAAASIELASQSRPGWLIEGLWAADGVGVIGGAPKCCKTWLSLDLAVSVSSGTDALGRFPVQSPGPVLLYGAEDAPVALRDRIETIARARGLGLSDLDLGLIVVDSLRLDAPRDRARLRATLAERIPRLIILDPLVRLHRIDENSAGEMSALLGELRAIQREHRVAIALVHHVRKNASPRGQDGQSLRGSGDLHAWGDSNLYLRRRDGQIVLTIEHRSAPSPPSCVLELTEEPNVHLRIAEGGPAEHEVATDHGRQDRRAPFRRTYQPRCPARRAQGAQRHPRRGPGAAESRGAHRPCRWRLPSASGRSRTRLYKGAGTERRVLIRAPRSARWRAVMGASGSPCPRRSAASREGAPRATQAGASPGRPAARNRNAPAPRRQVQEATVARERQQPSSVAAS